MQKLNDKVLGLYVRTKIEMESLQNEDGLLTSEYAGLTGVGITIVSLGGALLWTVTQTIINAVPATVTYPT